MTIRELVTKARLYTGEDYTYDIQEGRHVLFLNGSEVVSSPHSMMIAEWIEVIILTAEVKSKRLNVMIPVGLHKACMDKAKTQGSNLSEVITTLLLNYIHT